MDSGSLTNDSASRASIHIRKLKACLAPNKIGQPDHHEETSPTRMAVFVASMAEAVKAASAVAVAVAGTGSHSHHPSQSG